MNGEWKLDERQFMLIDQEIQMETAAVLQHHGIMCDVARSVVSSRARGLNLGWIGSQLWAFCPGLWAAVSSQVCRIPSDTAAFKGRKLWRWSLEELGPCLTMRTQALWRRGWLLWCNRRAGHGIHHAIWTSSDPWLRGQDGSSHWGPQIPPRCHFCFSV